MEFIEAKKSRFLRNGGGSDADGILGADFTQFRPLPQYVDALVYFGHEFMEMDAALTYDR